MRHVGARPIWATITTRAFNAIYPDLATRYDAILYPFFLAGVVTDQKLNQRDGLHPTAAGVDIIVNRILPKVEELIARVKMPDPN